MMVYAFSQLMHNKSHEITHLVTHLNCVISLAETSTREALVYGLAQLADQSTKKRHLGLS